jgi:hypothetical protein
MFVFLFLLPSVRTEHVYTSTIPRLILMYVVRRRDHSVLIEKASKYKKTHKLRPSRRRRNEPSHQLPSFYRGNLTASFIKVPFETDFDFRSQKIHGKLATVYPLAYHYLLMRLNSFPKSEIILSFWKPTRFSYLESFKYLIRGYEFDCVNWAR